MQKEKLFFLTLSLLLLITPPVASAQAPSATHVAAVVTAQRSAYAITDATNNCPHPATDILGWPSALVRECIYKGERKRVTPTCRRKPEIIATWIETPALSITDRGQCFERVLKCARGNSGDVFRSAAI